MMDNVINFIPKRNFNDMFLATVANTTDSFMKTLEQVLETAKRNRVKAMRPWLFISFTLWAIVALLSMYLLLAPFSSAINPTHESALISTFAIVAVLFGFAISTWCMTKSAKKHQNSAYVKQIYQNS